MPACRLGVLAFGDSITNGGGELQWGVALQSWALWTARGLGVPYSSFALDGATIGTVLGEQVPALPPEGALRPRLPLRRAPTTSGSPTGIAPRSSAGTARRWPCSPGAVTGC